MHGNAGARHVRGARLSVADCAPAPLQGRCEAQTRPATPRSRAAYSLLRGALLALRTVCTLQRQGKRGRRPGIPPARRRCVTCLSAARSEPLQLLQTLALHEVDAAKRAARV